MCIRVVVGLVICSMYTCCCRFGHTIRCESPSLLDGVIGTVDSENNTKTLSLVKRAPQYPRHSPITPNLLVVF